MTSTRDLDSERRCRNCDMALVGDYCHQCGQHDVDLDLRFTTLVGEWLGSVFGVEARLWRTLRLLIRQPGELTVRYLQGQRASMVSPLRLYLVASVTLFLMLSWTGSSVVVGAGEDSASPVKLTAHSPSQDSSPEPPAAPPAEAAAAEETDQNTDSVDQFFDTAGERIDSDRQAFDRIFREQSGRVIIVLVPAFALVLKLLFLGTGRPYVHHLVFSLHVYAFGFFVIALYTPVGWVAGNAIGVAGGKIANLGLVVYLYLALRRFYGQSRRRTMAKIVVLLLVNLTVLIAVLFAALVVTIWLLG